MSQIAFVDPLGKPSQDDNKPKVFNNEGAKFIEPKPNVKPPTAREEIRKKAMEDALLNPWVATALRGASWGLSDRAIAAGQSVLGDKPYADYLDQQFAQRDAFGDEHPYASFATELAGGLLTGGAGRVAVTGAAKAALPRVMGALSAKGVLPATGRAATVVGGGAGAGAVSGAGQADYGKTTEGAEKGALAGAIVAGGLKGAGKVLQGVNTVTAPIVNRAATAMGMTNPEKWAQKEWIKSLQMDGDNVESVLQRLRDAETHGPRGTMAMDVVGLNAKDKMKAATIPTTKARSELDQTMNQRSLDQVDRLGGDIKKAVSPRVDSANVADEIYQAGRTKADPLYAQAKALGAIDDPKVVGWFNATKNRQQVLRDYAKAMEDNGTPMGFKFTVDPKTSELVRVKAPTVEDLMNIKDHFGNLRKQLVNKDGSVDNKATIKINGNEYGYKVVNKEYNDLRDMVRGLTPDGNGGSLLAKADAIAGDSFEVSKALALGKKIRSLTSEDLKKEWGSLGSEAEKEAFRTGAASQLFSTLEKGQGGATAVQQLYGSNAMKQKMNTIFPDQNAQDYFAKVMGTEAKMAEAQRQLGPRVSAGSGMASDAADISPLGAAVNAAQGRFGAAASGLGRFFSNQWETSMPQYADPLLRLGMMGKDQVAGLVQQMNQPKGVLSRIGSAVGDAAGNVVRGAPYAAANVAGANAGEFPSFDAWLAQQQ